MIKNKNNSRVWILGSEASGIERSLSWISKEIPSFADCDILIVDLLSLDTKKLQSIDLDNTIQLFNEIKKRFETGLKIICISSETIHTEIPTDRGGYYSITNYLWSPIRCQVKKIPKGKTMKTIFPEDFDFQEYVDTISEWELALEAIMYCPNHPASTIPAYSMNPINIIQTNSGDLLGGEFSNSPASGRFILLPPLDTHENSINKILHILGINQITPPPKWVNSIVIPGTMNMQKNIQTLTQEIQEKQQQISSLSIDIENKNKLKQLVYETSNNLENIVKESLELLCLKNVREGKPGKDDILFDFQKNKQYQSCSIEVKGVEGNIKLKDLRQLGQWVDDNLESKIKTKGMLISNTFRLDDLSKTKKQRSDLEKENLEYAIKQEFCILPTHVLLDMCIWILAGNTPNIDKIENAIANTKGFLKLDDLK